jgi:hypothetical protein
LWIYGLNGIKPTISGGLVRIISQSQYKFRVLIFYGIYGLISIRVTTPVTYCSDVKVWNSLCIYYINIIEINEDKK